MTGKGGSGTPAPGLGDGRQQLMRLQAEHVGDAFHVVQRDVARLPFDVPDERAVQAGLMGQVFLGPPMLGPQPDHVQGQDFSGGNGGW